MKHTFDPIMWEAEASDLCEFEANLPIIESSRLLEGLEALSQKNNHHQKNFRTM